MPDKDQTDLDFLKEIRMRIYDFKERRDPEQLNYALEMISDWVDELQTANNGGNSGRR